LAHDERLCLQDIHLAHDKRLYWQAIRLAHDEKLYLEAIRLAHDEWHLVIRPDGDGTLDKMYLQAVSIKKLPLAVWVMTEEIQPNKDSGWHLDIEKCNHVWMMLYICCVSMNVLMCERMNVWMYECITVDDCTTV